jgi:hypothetical protein
MNSLGQKLEPSDVNNDADFYQKVTAECDKNIILLWEKYGDSLTKLKECSETLTKLTKIHGDDWADKLLDSNVLTQQTEELKAQQAAEFAEKLAELQKGFNAEMVEIQQASKKLDSIMT